MDNLNIFYNSIESKSYDIILIRIKNWFHQFCNLVDIFNNKKKRLLEVVEDLYNCHYKLIDFYDNHPFDFLYIDHKIMIYLISNSILFNYIYLDNDIKKEITYIEFINGSLDVKNMIEYFESNYYVDNFESLSVSSSRASSSELIDELLLSEQIYDLSSSGDSEQIMTPKTKISKLLYLKTLKNIQCSICYEENLNGLECINNHILACFNCITKLKKLKCPICQLNYE